MLKALEVRSVVLQVFLIAVALTSFNKIVTPLGLQTATAQNDKDPLKSVLNRTV